MILKVEPLTTARALRGPFDYALGGAVAEAGVGSVLVVPFGRRRVLGVVVDVAEESDLPPERLAEPIAALEADVPPELVRLGLWMAREYVSTRARGLALVLPPGTGTGKARAMTARRSLLAAITPAGEAALDGGGAARPAPARGARRARGRASARQRARRGHRLRPRRRAPARVARAGGGRGGARGRLGARRSGPSAPVPVRPAS